MQLFAVGPNPDSEVGTADARGCKQMEEGAMPILGYFGKIRLHPRLSASICGE